ncbi:MAG: histidine kinase [Chloroflexi bacterium]|jgi:signal transduction histidine kinase|nr:histidine kinase [Chloroflexota bacterium]
MTPGSSWSTLQLAEFLAIVSSFTTEASAALGAVERVAEALDAEVVAIIAHGQPVAAVGYPAGAVPAGELDSVAGRAGGALAVPGIGVCPAIAVPLEHPPGATLVVARSEPHGSLNREEVGVLHGMARVTSMTLGMLRLIDHERERQATLEWLANEQAALRRVAVLVARGAPQEQVFAAVAEEVSRVSSADMVHMFRYEPDGVAVRVAVWGSHEESLVGSRYGPGGHNITTAVLRCGRAARIDDATQITGSPAAISRLLGVRSVVGSPIVVDGRLWGLIAATTTRPEPIPADMEQRISGFTELVATAISNAQARSELTESRARVVAAADQTRRQIERDLHDGAQQRLVALALTLRAAEASVPAELDALRSRLSQVADGLVAVQHELQEMSRGLHPAMLSRGGLRPALRTLARRSPVPVEMDVRVDERLPESVEVAAYYVVSEALANVAKHARASLAHVHLDLRGRTLRVVVRDDGVGGADPTRGSGMVGLSDRVAGLGGTITVASPPGDGTSMVVELPLDPVVIT